MFKNVKNNQRTKDALKLVQSYVKSLEESHLNNLVIEKEKPKENLQVISSRSQFKKV